MFVPGKNGRLIAVGDIHGCSHILRVLLDSIDPQAEDVTTLASYGVNTAREIPGDHLRFFADCKDYLESDEYIFVHAGCDPDIMLEKNNGGTLRWAKFPKEPKIHNSGKTVICGHTVQKQILDLGHICCIDTGCGVWPGGRLTAIDLKSGKIWQAGGRSKKATIKQRG